MWEDRIIIDVRAAADKRPVLGLAVDVGTTTIAAYLCDLATGDVLATESAMNPQVAFGDDVIARLHYVTHHEGGLQELQRTVIGEVNDLAGKAVARAGARASTTSTTWSWWATPRCTTCSSASRPGPSAWRPSRPPSRGRSTRWPRAVGLTVQPRLPPARASGGGRLRRRRQRGRDHRRRALQAGRSAAAARYRHQRRAGAGQQGTDALHLLRHRTRRSRARISSSACGRRPAPSNASASTRRPSTCASRSSAWRAGSTELPPEEWAPGASAVPASSRRPAEMAQGQGHPAERQHEPRPASTTGWSTRTASRASSSSPGPRRPPSAGRSPCRSRTSARCSWPKRRCAPARRSCCGATAWRSPTGW